MAHVKPMRFSKAEFNVVHLDQGKPQHQPRLGDEQIKSSPAQRDLGVLVDENLDMTKLCAPTDRRPAFPGLHPY